MVFDADQLLIDLAPTGPFSYSEESDSNDILLHFVDFSNVDKSHRSSNATRSNSHIKAYKNNARSRLFCRIDKRFIVVI